MRLDDRGRQRTLGGSGHPWALALLAAQSTQGLAPPRRSRPRQATVGGAGAAEVPLARAARGLAAPGGLGMTILAALLIVAAVAGLLWLWGLEP
jgi:hypothetical protein